jgi:hypothetical protein
MQTDKKYKIKCKLQFGVEPHIHFKKDQWYDCDGAFI